MTESAVPDPVPKTDLKLPNARQVQAVFRILGVLGANIGFLFRILPHVGGIAGIAALVLLVVHLRKPEPGPVPIPEPDKPVFSIPSQVNGKAGENIYVEANATSPVVWYVYGLKHYVEGLPFRVDSSKKAINFSSPKAGTYFVIASSSKDGESLAWQRCRVTIVGPGPDPEPEPEPEPGPGPTPVGDLRVIMVRETTGKLTKAQEAVFWSPAITSYCEQKVVKGPNGQPEFRKWDKDVVLSDKESAKLRELWPQVKSSLPTLPCFVIFKGDKAFVSSILPEMKEAEALELLKKYGG